MKAKCEDVDESLLPDDRTDLENLGDSKVDKRATQLWKKLEENTNSTHLKTDTSQLSSRKENNLTEIITEMAQLYNEIKMLKFRKDIYCCGNFK